MSVSNVYKQASGSRGHEQKGDTAQIESYTVLCTDIADSEIVARQAAGIPKRGEPHSDDSTLRVKRVEAQRRGNSALFDVRVEYRPAKLKSGDDSTSPLDRAAQCSVNPVISTEPISHAVRGSLTDLTNRVLQRAGLDTTDNPIINCAGVAPYPQVMMEVADIGIMIVRNEKSYSLSRMLPYWNKLNSDAWWDFDPRQVRCRYIIGASVEEDVDGEQFEYWRVSYHMIARNNAMFEGWALRIPNWGTSYRGADGELHPIVDAKTGDAISEPVPLTLAGDGLSTQLWRLRWNIYEEIAFAPLQLRKQI